MEKYKYFLGPFIALMLGQLIKFAIESIKQKRLMWGRLFNGSGGMPSSHVTVSWTLLFMFLFNEGLSSKEFAITFVFCIIVAYDAMCIRYESGKQATAIKKLMTKVPVKNAPQLKEQLGHRMKEVIAGIFLALAISLIFTFLLK